MASTAAIAAILKLWQELKENMPEELERKLDEEIDKLEDKYKEGSWKDVGMEIACGILRGTMGVEDFPDE